MWFVNSGSFLRGGKDGSGAMELKALSLFSGIGGLDLAAEMAGIETVALCEIEPFPVEVLKKRFPDVPIFSDVRKLKRGDIDGTIDIIHGGFPCQDLSVAGVQKGLEDEEGKPTARSGLWFEMLRVIHEIRPRYVVAENVRGAVNLALDTVQAGMEDEGYKVWAFVLPAAAFGAPHQRERLFVVGVREDVANSACERLQRSLAKEGFECGGESGRFMAVEGSGAGLWPTPRANKIGGSTSEGYGLCLQEAVNGGRDTKLWRTPDAHCDRGPSSEERMKWKQENKMPVSINDQVQHEGKSKGQLNPDWVEQLMNFPEGWTDLEVDEPSEWVGWPALLGQEQYPYEFPRTTTRCPNRAKRLKALGNAVVPAQAYPFFKAITEIEKIIREGER